MTSGAKKILIVDDDTDFVEAVSSFLESKDYSVFKAHDGQEALKLAKMEHPDLVIMDVMMTERTEGFFVIQEIRRTPDLAKVPVIVLSSLWSSDTDFKIAPGSDWLGHDKFLPKPVDMSELLDEIRLCINDDSKTGKSEDKEEAES